MFFNKFIGNIGEKIAEKYLKRCGYKILERNLKYKFIEIDILALKNKIIYIFEVKTFSCETDLEIKNDTFSNVDVSHRKQNIHKLSKDINRVVKNNRKTYSDFNERMDLRIKSKKINKMKIFADYYLNQNPQYQNIRIGIINIKFNENSKTPIIDILEIF